jgi:hypothetical protein
MQIDVWVVVPPVEVGAGQRRTVVAVDHAVGVQHGYDAEYECFPQLDRLGYSGDEEVNQSMNHER